MAGRDHRKEKVSPEELEPLTNSDLKPAEDVDAMLLPEDKEVEVEAVDKTEADHVDPVPEVAIPDPSHHRPSGATAFLEVLDVKKESPPAIHSSFSHDDMNKMFETPRKFSLADLVGHSDEPEVSSHERRLSKPSLADYYHVDETDYASHRRNSFPHIHQPLRSLSARLLKGNGSAFDNVTTIEKLKRKRKKKKKKKKKKKVRSYPSRNAMQSPTILEETEEDDDDDETQDSDETEDSEDLDGAEVNAVDLGYVLDQIDSERREDEDDESMILMEREETPLLPEQSREIPATLPLSTAPELPTSPGRQVPTTLAIFVHEASPPDSLTEHRSPSAAEPLFFLGGEVLGDHDSAKHLLHTQHLLHPLNHLQAAAKEGVDKGSGSSLVKVPSVAAQRFRRSVSEEPTATPMFGDFSTEDEPRLSERAAQLSNHHGGSTSQLSIPSHVQQGSVDGGVVKFVVGEDDSMTRMDDHETWAHQGQSSQSGSASSTPPPAPKSMKRVPSTESTRSKGRHHHHHRHEHFKQQDLAMRRQKGSEVHLQDALKVSPTEFDEARMLPKSDLDQMSSHRFAELPGMRRSKIAKRKGTLHSIVHISKAHKEKRERPKKKHFDHSPHEVFVELDELHMTSDTEFEWREKARWIKFEEDVEEGAERWGKPHVASLSFHSLLELRKGLESGVLLLDLEATDLPTIVNAVVEKLVVQDLLYEGERGKLIRTLLLKHKHQHEKSLMKTFSHASFGSNAGGLHRSMSHLANNDSKDKPAKLEMVKVDVDNNMTDGVHIGLVPIEQQKKYVADIMRRIPQGSEVSTVLVGQVDYMLKPALVFVRLSEGQFLDNLTEVPLPVRFIFILLGPEKCGMDYHEVGRSISTLMSNQAFHNVAYNAESRDELLQAINLFLDDSIVLPPGDWDQRTLLPIMDMARKRAAIRRKLKQKEKEEILNSGRRISVVFRTLDKLSTTLMEKRPTNIPVDPLKRTGRLFGGLINDIKRRYPLYISDFRDGLSFKCIMTTIFITFACLSPCIAFGGLLAEKTDSLLGVKETMLGTSVSGMLWSLFSGQPMLILGPTGPVLVFEQSLYKFTKSYDVEFLPMRVWIGLYVALISIVVVALEGSFLVRYVTRFAEEIFAILISIIFIYEVVKKLVDTFEQHPLLSNYCPVNDSALSESTYSDFNSTYLYSSALYTTPAINNLTLNGGHSLYSESNNLPSNKPNTALLSLILTIGTFLIAYFLRIFRNSRFLGRRVRRALGDFGVLIALLCMSLLAYLMKDTYVQTLDVKYTLEPTRPEKRGWFINPMGIRKVTPVWVIFASIIPAILIFILLFLEVQITEMIMNKKERKLQKGCGFHLDQFIVGILTFLSGLFGAPWLCAATVRTMAHVSSLSSYSRTHAPGEKPHLLGVKEQRLTNFAVHLFIGMSLLLNSVLKAIPVMTLFGVFLYLGVSALGGVQMFERMKLLLMPVKYHPPVGYVRRVRVTRMHTFTLIQLVLLMVMLVIKSTEAALIFPFALLLLMPLRHRVLNRIFTPQELHELDKEEEEEEIEDLDDPDFYAMAHMPV